MSEHPKRETWSGAAVSDFRVGDRVELHPLTELWMRGARFGEVKKLGRSLITIEVDVTGKLAKFAPADLVVIERKLSTD